MVARPTILIAESAILVGFGGRTRVVCKEIQEIDVQDLLTAN
jgi:hypothetical protein